MLSSHPNPNPSTAVYTALFVYFLLLLTIGCLMWWVTKANEKETLRLAEERRQRRINSNADFGLITEALSDISNLRQAIGEIAQVDIGIGNLDNFGMSMNPYDMLKDA